MQLLLSAVTVVLVLAFGVGVLSKLSEIVSVLRNIDKNLVEAALDAKAARTPQVDFPATPPPIPRVPSATPRGG